MSEMKRFDYPGKQIDVHWDGRLCIHVEECVRAKGDLFAAGREPWCIPDSSLPQEVAGICERCPSVALTYTDKSGHVEKATAENTVSVTHNGPLYVRGDLAIAGAPDDMPGIELRAALCRCGQSKNKPFCDNSHEAAGFKDYGAVGDPGDGFDAPGGP